jgi:hypothetical protein
MYLKYKNLLPEIIFLSKGCLELGRAQKRRLGWEMVILTVL